MNKVLNVRNLLLAVCCFSWFAAISQVDESKPRQDTLYIYEEEVTYDTLYLQGSQLDELLTKEELMEAFQNRGIGQIYYNKGRFWLTGNEEVYKLDKADLQMLFSPAQYDDYRKSKRNQYISIPLFVAGGGAAAIAGIGLVQFCASFIQTAKYHEQLLDSDDLALNIWRSAMGGVFLCGGGMLVAAGCLVPATILTIKSKVHLNNIANDFNTSKTSLRLSLGTTPQGIGITLLF
ncbi:MAG: hypothetical protein IKZ54_03505 [Bacteroidales bacterium]|nr:hypothetical protein [Bacteroidales bacterium]